MLLLPDDENYGSSELLELLEQAAGCSTYLVTCYIIKTSLEHIRVCFMMDENGITHKEVVFSLQHIF